MTRRKKKDSPNTPVKVAREFHLDFLNPSQELAWRQYENHDLLCLLGSAGTGKTFLAMGFAIHDLLQGKREKIVVTRPIVEAGESLGYLPGDFTEKVMPYMIPMYDCLQKIVGKEGFDRDKINASLEIVPLAYMRGRAEPLDNQILTPKGYVRMGDINVGDEVIGSDGTPIKVLGTYPQGIKLIYKVVFSDGTSVKCSGDHLWSTRTQDESSFSVKTTTDIRNSLIANDPFPQHFMPLLSGAVEFNAIDIDSDPYTIGYNSIQDNTYKPIPFKYKFNCIKVRLDVLSGLIHKIHPQISCSDSRKTYFFDSKKIPPLAVKDIAFLIRSLGGVVNENAFCVLLSEIKDYRKFHGVNKIKYIVGVEPCGEEECQCISVDANDNLYLTGDFVITHNTFDNSVFILDEAQNCTHEQLKLAITRLGFGSKMIITGDPGQSDLIGRLALEDVVAKITPVQGVAVMRFRECDVVRHHLVARLLKVL